MNNAQMNELKAGLATAKAQLLAEGWLFTHSVMHDGGATGHYGSCFVKRSADGSRVSFYLNKDTYKQLPVRAGEAV